MSCRLRDDKSSCHNEGHELLPRELRQYTNRKIFIALGAIIIVALIATVTSLIALSALTVVRATGQANSATLSNLQDLLLQVRTAESYERGYLLGNNTTFLDRAHTAMAAARTDLANLSHNLPPNASPTYRADLARLASLTQAKLGLMNTIAQQNNTGAITVDLTEDQADMNAINAKVASLSNDQAALLATARANISGLDATARDISLATVFLTLILAGVVNYLYARAIQAERELDRAKDEFVSLASHQLRTPVTGIKAILSSLASGDFGPLEPRQAYFVDKALSSSEHELAVIEELLDVAKADAGRLMLHAGAVDLVQLVDDVVAEQRHTIEAKHLTVKLQQPDKPIALSADREKLHMAIGNLIDNARKYTPESGIITIKTHVKRKIAHVEISDTGIGIDPGDLDRIFDRFGRAATAPESHIDGTGLGLYLAHHIAELHRGTIEVTSRRGHGSRFTMTLPIGET